MIQRALKNKNTRPRVTDLTTNSTLFNVTNSLPFKLLFFKAKLVTVEELTCGDSLFRNMSCNILARYNLCSNHSIS